MQVIMLENPTEADWLKAKQRALVTVGLTTEKAPAEDWKIKMLKCRHSPIRKLPFAFLIIGIPYWLHCELVRHHIGIEKYVKSQRDDRNTDETPRAEKPQGALVNMIIDLNGESILTLMNKRLCGNATREMQELMLMIREEVIKTNPEFKPFLIPMCKYLNSCNEFNSCGKKALFFEKSEQTKKWVDNYEDYQNASNNITFSDYPYYRGK